MHPYHQVVELDFELPTRFYTGMLVVWLLRPNLQRKFPLHKNRRSDYLAFLAWCAMIGRRECRLLQEIEAWNQELLRPAKLPVLKNDPWTGTFTVGMYLAGLHRSKYWSAQIQANPKLRHRAARWYFREGRQAIGLQQVPAWQLKAIQTNFSEFENFKDAILLPRDDQSTKTLVAENCQDIAKRWRAHETEDSPSPVSIKKVAWAKRLAAATLPVAANKLLPVIRKSAPGPDSRQLTQIAWHINAHLQTKSPEKAISKPFGVNLFGYAKGELGIGEDVRMLALALKGVGVPFCIINIELGKDVSQKDSSADGWVVSEPKYSINIFCMTGIEMCRYITETGTDFLSAYYNIGLWPWELPRWPEAWHHSWSLVDELWGISQYTAAAYANAPVPVIPMPLPVVINEVAPLSRRDWKLPAEAFLFVFSFDMNSKPARKNPQAVIRAFKKATEECNENQAGLVLKVSHLKPQDPEWQTLETLIGEDPRIHLITTELRRPEVLSLYQNCDCYVALHRSEGFGRALAEAQLLGMPLIATGFSGNMEFCQPPTHRVDYVLINLKKNEYFFGDGQHWAEPSIDHAAELMKEQLAQGRGHQPVQYDTERFSPEYCGKQFKKRLNAIAQPAEKEIFLHEH